MWSVLSAVILAHENQCILFNHNSIYVIKIEPFIFFCHIKVIMLHGRHWEEKIIKKISICLLLKFMLIF